MTSILDRVRPTEGEPRGDRWLAFLALLGLTGFENPIGFLFFGFLIYLRLFLTPRPKPADGSDADRRRW